MTTTPSANRRAFLVLAALPILLTGCRAEYHGHDSGIDGALWRQIASFEDALSWDLSQPSDGEPGAYLDGQEVPRWDGSEASAAALDLRSGGVAIYDVSSTDSAAGFSVFIASGPRPDIVTDEGRTYSGPSTVYTCYGIEAEFQSSAGPSADKTIFDDCPPTLVELLPEDAAFASGAVFDG
ncbi:hypothetical protein GCM10009750_35000 [Agromyces salentinus]|uniref:Uncharacterized protein n=1 Tax=Agromyces salentinus TaxID=269421 RepID=A0ABN2MZH0_9MICO